jgi:putative transcriptional regulator
MPREIQLRRIFPFRLKFAKFAKERRNSQRKNMLMRRLLPNERFPSDFQRTHAATVIFLVLAPLAVSAYSQPLATGMLLVATPRSNDPDFAHSVVLLIKYDSDSAIGLILNKPTSVPISDALPDASGTVTVYGGGPVTIGIRALVRSKAPPFFAVVSNKRELHRIISSGVPPFRIFAGYTGWTTPQLESEIARGLWKVLPAKANILFDSRPQTLWRRLASSQER